MVLYCFDLIKNYFGALNYLLAETQAFVALDARAIAPICDLCRWDLRKFFKQSGPAQIEMFSRTEPVLRPRSPWDEVRPIIINY